MTLDSSKRVLLFTGHMIDTEKREAPRFPNTKEKIVAAKRAIAEVVADEQKASGIAFGIAGCASGGDILFHRVCEELDIPSQILLALPHDRYIQASVAPAGPEWVEAFNKLTQSHPVILLNEDKPDNNIWQRNNLWLLHSALAAAGGENVTLIALWNGEAGDGPGGTGDLVQQARERGAKIVILDTKKIFGDSSA